jgi:hypothetical protein
MLSFRDSKLLEIKRVMHALAADKSDASAEAYGLLHEYWVVLLCAKDGPAPAGPRESVRVPRAIAPTSSADQAAPTEDSTEAVPPAPQPPEFKSWLKGMIDGDGGPAPELA